MQDKSSKGMKAVHKYVSPECIVNFAKGFTGQIRDAQKCVELMRDLLKKDHLKGYNPFTNEVALDLDQLEGNRVQGITTKMETVDYIVGLGKDWLLLVEAKLDADKPDHFCKGLKDKRNHSRELITSSDYDAHVENEYVILLKDNKFEQNKDRLRNLSNGLPHLKPMRVIDFFNEYFKS